MSPIVGSDRPEAPVPTAFAVEEELVPAVSPRARGRLPMRSALLHPAEVEYTPPLKDHYWSRRRLSAIIRKINLEIRHCAFAASSTVTLSTTVVQ